MSGQGTQLFSNDATLEVLDPDTLTLHPVVFLFPELNQTDFDALVNSVRAHGQIDPVWITSDNEIIDGRHRWKAQRKLGAQVQCRRLKNFAPELLTSVIDHCIAQNLNRRHMNKDQRSIVAAALEKKRIEAVAAQERGELSLDGGTGFSWSTFDELLATFRIKKSYYDNAAKVIEYGQPELADACANGTISLSTALYGARKTKPLTKGEVKHCLSQEDPSAAIIKHCNQKNAKRSERARKLFFGPDYVQPSAAYNALMDLYCQRWYDEEDLNRIDALDFSGVWQEEPNEVLEIFNALNNGVLARQKLIAKLESVRPSDGHIEGDAA